ncbi:transposase [Variovorax rhizosphaerae]|uniref:Transposase n=1 Tax=Variovorax rhizosphaerae TaxID=1836200 RepID=A0ABU8WZ26_9BURK
MHPNSSNRRVHSADFKARVLAECRQPGASVSAVAIAHGLNANVVRKWLTGRGLKRMSAATPAISGVAPALQFVPVAFLCDLVRSATRGDATWSSAQEVVRIRYEWPARLARAPRGSFNSRAGSLAAERGRHPRCGQAA